MHMKSDEEQASFFVALTVKDVEASVKWYQEVLGFERIFGMPAPDGKLVLAHMRWMACANILLRLDLEPAVGAMDKGKGVELSFQIMDGNIDEFAKRVKEFDAHILQKPYNTPWNTREFTVADPDGFRLTFVQTTVTNERSDELFVE